jgi:nucleoside-triphosphatase THEP1
MLKKPDIPDIWLKAALLGSLWASIEIILGSFLHNMRIPMTGTLLSAVGASILIGGHQLWPEKGLFWRAGLICAVMKSISPSAVIIGPMIGIFMEGVLLQLGIRLLGTNTLGYMVSGALAVSWSMVQKIINLLVALGADFVRLYENLYHYAARNLGLDTMGPFDLVLVFYLLQMFMGAIVALFAIRVGKSARHITPQNISRTASASQVLDVDPTQDFSLPLLGLHFLAVISGLTLLSHFALWWTGPLVGIYIAFLLSYYKRSLHRLRKASLWIGLFVVIMLSALFLNGFSAKTWNWNGLIAGLTMSVRAVLVILAFTAISIELRNPKILNWFMRKGLQNFPKSLAVAFETLPYFISFLSEQRHILKRFKTILPTLLKQADVWLTEFQNMPVHPLPVVILTGTSGQGKTTLVREIIDILNSKNYNIQGIYAPGYWKDNQRDGFDIVDIASGERTQLCRNQATADSVSVGPFSFRQSGITFGRDVLSHTSLQTADFIIVDEVGPLELRGNGWAPALDHLMESVQSPMLWVVRTKVIREVIIRWVIEDPIVKDIKDTHAQEIVDLMIDLKKQQTVQP